MVFFREFPRNYHSFLFFCIFVGNNAIMKFKDGLKIRNIAGQKVIIKQGKLSNDQVDMTRVISLNDTSVFLFEELQEKEFTMEDVKNLLLEHYDVEEEVAVTDSKAWIEKLSECQLLD